MKLGGEEVAKFYAQLVEVRDARRFATLDLRTAWEDYVRRSPRPREWYKRDSVHANLRGKQVMGRIVARYFSPDPVVAAPK